MGPRSRRIRRQRKRRRAAALPLLAATVPAGWWFLKRRGKHARGPARAVIESVPGSTVIAKNGGVRSIQSARLRLDPDDLERLWSPEQLENLGATYWQFLNRVTLGLVRVAYGDQDRRVVLLSRRIVLLRFDLPDYEMDAERGRIAWPIKDGLLVATRGRSQGYLSLEVRRTEGGTELDIDVEVANFYPAIGYWLGTFIYEMTQSFLHVLVTQAFLRSLASLNLVQSKVARMAPMPGTTNLVDALQD